jgi:hypothetical protein
MQKIVFLVGCIFCVLGSFAQETLASYPTKKIAFSKDTITIEKFSINNSFFEIKDKKGATIDPSFYQVNFQKGTLLFTKDISTSDTLVVHYTKFPDFLTKTYSIYDDSKVVSNEAGKYVIFKKTPTPKYKPFDGLNTSGSITRGVTIGNNQNAVVNSNLDLQITGKISDKVSLRASIQDSNIPLQEGGYSQKLDEFDQLFIELFSEKWNIRAGDLFLENRKSAFLNFNKKVQGLSTKFTFGKPTKKTEVVAAGALVRGQYARSSFVGQEGNQGPYKLRGNNNELYVLVISGSERVYVNGILKTRGENKDYIIDYNAGEIIFTSLFPITSEMRINIEYQYTDRNFTRFITYGGITHDRKNWQIGGYVYSEGDVKNQPLQQNLSSEQIAILQNAGDDLSQMNGASAYLDSYSENKILYKKTLINGVEVFQYSNNPDDELYNVRFSLVGNLQGNYVLVNNQAVGKIYEYRAPIAGEPQGNYEPVIRLIAPNKIQIATIIGKYQPNEKTNLDFEWAVSNNDQNLYSNSDDANNKGFAGKFNVKQRLWNGKTTLDAFTNYQLVQENFKTIERLYNIEFNRDWNITSTLLGNQSFLTSGLEFNFNNKGKANYQFDNVSFGDAFFGNKHSLSGRYSTKKWNVWSHSSFMKSDSKLSESTFSRSQNRASHTSGKNWIGASLKMENNAEKIKSTNEYSALSQRFVEYGAFVGRGDSTKVFVELGVLQRQNDSLQNQRIERVNHSTSYYLKSNLIKTEKSNLSLFLNYRKLTYEDPTLKDEPSLNSRILYSDRYFGQLIQTTTAYETSSGTIAQQEFTYLEVAPGQGIYQWNDYNGNGIQELQEFEIAPYPDLAIYVRVFLPNQIFIRTHQNKFSQALNFNFNQWQNKTGWKKWISHFYNQTSLLMEQKNRRNEGDFEWNPWTKSKEETIGLNTNFRNSLFYNRGKQLHSTTYSYVLNENKNELVTGSVHTKNQSHQLQYQHLLQKSWLINLSAFHTKSTSNIANYANRNFNIESRQFESKIGYLFSKNASWSLVYEFQQKANQMGFFEALKQTRIGSLFVFNSDKGYSINGEFSMYTNTFKGNAVSAVGFQMLEGLQPGKNQTWRLLLQKNLTDYLDININYQGRNSETSKSIHTGNIQLRAFF